MISRKTAFYGLGRVVGSCNKLASAEVANTLCLGLAIYLVESSRALAAFQSALKAIYNRFVRNIQIQHAVNFYMRFVKLLRLRKRPRKSVKDKSVFTVVLRKT